MQRSRIVLAVLYLLACSSIPALSKDAPSIAALTRSVQALGLTQALSGVSLQGNAAYTAGSEQDSFAVLFTGSGFDDAQLVLERSSGIVTEVRHKGAGTWTAGPDAATHSYPLHNTWTTAAWFSPSLVVAEWIGDPELVLSDIGPEQRDGIAVEHLHCYRVPAGEMDSGTASLIAQASQMDLYLDSTSWLPIALEFNTHPDSNESIDMPVRIEFSNYQRSADGTAPLHLQKFLQNTLLLEITVSSTNLNAPALPTTSANQQ